MKSFQLKYIGLITKKVERCRRQAVVTGVLFNVSCHRVCVFVSLSMPIKKTRYTRLIIKNAQSQFNEISEEAQ